MRTARAGVTRTSDMFEVPSRLNSISSSVSNSFGTGLNEFGHRYCLPSTHVDDVSAIATTRDETRTINVTIPTTMRLGRCFVSLRLEVLTSLGYVVRIFCVPGTATEFHLRPPSRVTMTV